MQEGTPIIIKKKKAHGHAHHGGAWKVAYADFVTAMMAFFMVMWIMGMDQPTREVIAGYFKDPLGFEKNTPKHTVNIMKSTGALVTTPGKGGADSAHRSELAAMRNLEEQVQQTIEKDAGLKKLEDHKAIQLELTPEGLQIELIENETNSELFFTIGSAEVRPQARTVLAKLAPLLQGTGRKMVVDGHTDARPLNRPGYDNFDLSHDRANAVRRLLIQGGCTDDRFLAVRGFAANELRHPEDPYHFSNRRVSILIPYAFNQGVADDLPAKVNKESIQGVFRFPKIKPDSPEIGSDH